MNKLTKVQNDNLILLKAMRMILDIDIAINVNMLDSGYTIMLEEETGQVIIQKLNGFLAEEGFVEIKSKYMRKIESYNNH